MIWSMMAKDVIRNTGASVVPVGLFLMTALLACTGADSTDLPQREERLSQWLLDV